MKYKFENVKLIKVIDADTLDVIIDFGFKLRQEVRIRLNRIDAWETRGKEKEKGLEAKEFVKKLLSEKLITKIETFKKGKYGRYLAEVYVNKRNLNDLLVKLGHAECYEIN